MTDKGELGVDDCQNPHCVARFSRMGAKIIMLKAGVDDAKAAQDAYDKGVADGMRLAAPVLLKCSKDIHTVDIKAADRLRDEYERLMR